MIKPLPSAPDLTESHPALDRRQRACRDLCPAPTPTEPARCDALAGFGRSAKESRRKKGSYDHRWGSRGLVTGRSPMGCSP